MRIVHSRIRILLLTFLLACCNIIASAQTVIKLEKEGRTYKTNCTVNGLKLILFLDTGADEVVISALEALFMLENGYLSADDILGTAYYETASGDIVEGTQIILRKIEIGGIVLENVKAGIVHSLSAPLLMGQSALSRLGKIIIDYDKNTLTIPNGPKKTYDFDKTANNKAANRTHGGRILPGSSRPAMVHVAGGSFKMGNNFGNEREKPVHEVTLNGFSMGRYEVTTEQFREFVLATGYQTSCETDNWVTFWNGKTWDTKHGLNWRYNARGLLRQPEEAEEPVLYVTWTDAQKYCQWLSGKTGRKYRLPTEAEWEFAAKDGVNKGSGVYAHSNDIDEVGWYRDNAGATTHVVGMKRPNALGICDLTGNVLEYCADWFDPHYSGLSVTNPHGPQTGEFRVSRGGAWHSTPDESRCTDRHWDAPWSRCNYNGFRVVMEEL